jgi:hypothetical protein
MPVVTIPLEKTSSKSINQDFVDRLISSVMERINRLVDACMTLHDASLDANLV